MELGLCQDTHQIYEGTAQYGRMLDPAPVVSPCKIVTSKADCSVGPKSNSPTDGYVFREDYFDPKSRIRRGRIYAAYSSQPHVWRAPILGHELGRMNTYGRCSIWAQFLSQGHRPLYVLLGDERRFTVWKLVDVEVVTSGEELITLKALTTFGILPELLESEIPENELDLIRTQLGKVVDDMYTATADSIVDCCREGATAVLGAYLGKPNLDLGQLKNHLAKLDPPKLIAVNMADTLAKLHSRRKTAELRSRGLRPITDEDAQIAVSCLGMLLVELNWARW